MDTDKELPGLFVTNVLETIAWLTPDDRLELNLPCNATLVLILLMPHPDRKEVPAYAAITPLLNALWETTYGHKWREAHGMNAPMDETNNGSSMRVRLTIVPASSSKTRWAIGKFMDELALKYPSGHMKGYEVNIGKYIFEMTAHNTTLAELRWEIHLLATEYHIETRVQCMEIHDFENKLQ